MSAASTLYISGCKDHPGTTDLSCCRIRRADGTPLDIREVWAVIQKMEADRAELEEQRRELLEACKAFLQKYDEDIYAVDMLPYIENIGVAVASAGAAHE